MKATQYLAMGAAAVLFSACVPSVNPYFTAKDCVFDGHLLGEWKDNGQEEQSWKFEQGDGKAYKLTITEKGGKKGQLEAHLLELKQERFLDLLPADCNFHPNQADIVGASMFPGHLLARLTQRDSTLKVAFFKFEWLDKYLTENPGALAHHREENRLVLTAGTHELQRFVLEHLGEGELFEKPLELERKAN